MSIPLYRARTMYEALFAPVILFKTGDRVRTKAGTHINHIKPLEECEVVVPSNAFGCCEVVPVSSGGRPYIVWDADLEYIPAKLPVGNQPLLDQDSLDQLMLEAAAFEEVYYKPKTRKCDCGGLKTHGSLEPMFHSHWCSSQKA